MSGAQQPLSGLRILDFTQNLPGPYATFVLASLGADVVKVEPPRGDPARFTGPFFSMVNRGKRSITLDLRDPSTQPALEALVGWADVLVEGFRPGVMARLGCDYEAAQAMNAGIIYCSISAYGQEGPRRDEPGHDLNLQAVSGLCHLERDAQGTPRGLTLPVADLSTSLIAVSSICAALAGGRGESQYLDVAMSDAVFSWTWLWDSGVDLSGAARAAIAKAPASGLLERLTRGLTRALERQKLYVLPQYGLYRARDGRYLAFGAVDERHFWEGLCDVLGLGRFRGLSMPMRAALSPVLRRLFKARVRMRDSAHWLERFTEAGVPVTPVLTPKEALRESQYLSRDFLDREGFVRAPLPGAAHLTGDAPELGEHTRDILEELDVEAV